MKIITIIEIFLFVLLCIETSINGIEANTGFKLILVGIIIVLLLVLSIVNIQNLLYFFVGGAILKGFNFLVEPSNVEVKDWFSYFYISLSGINIYFTDLFLIVGVITILLRQKSKRKIYFYTSMNLMHIFFLLFSLIITLFSINTYGKSALGDARIAFYSIFIVFSINSFRNVKQVEQFFTFFTIVSFFRAIINIVTVLVSPSYLEYQKPFGSGTDAQYFAISIIILMVLKDKVSIPRTIKVIMGTLFLSLLILITSRSAILSFFVALFFYFNLNHRLIKKEFFSAIVISLFVLVITLIVFANMSGIEQYVVDRFIPLFSGYQKDGTSLWRIVSWEIAMESIIKNPIFGVGFGSYAERFMFGEWVTLSLHNAYFDILYRLGAVGLFLFSGIVFLPVRKSYLLFKFSQRRTDQDGKEIFLVIFLVLMSFLVFIAFNAEFSYALSGLIFWIFIGFIMNNRLFILE